MVAKHQPDVLLLDLSMPPGESGLVATGKIKEDFPETKILVLTMHDDEEYLFHVLKNMLSHLVEFFFVKLYLNIYIYM
jgi:two-component system response regulator NreC